MEHKLYCNTILVDKYIMRCFSAFTFMLIFYVTNAVHAQDSASFAESVIENKRKNDPFTLLNSAMEPKLSDGTPVYTSKISANYAANPCTNAFALNLGDRPFMELMKQASGATGQLFCFEKVSAMKQPYTSQYCSSVQACSNSIMGEQGLGIDAGTFIQKVLAEDFIQSEIKNRVNDMEKIENISKYMKQKYPNELSVVCPSRFSDSIKDSVCSARINNIFKESQKKCLYMKLDCYAESKQGLIGFREFSEKSDGTFVNTFTRYFNERSDEYLKKVTSTEDEAVTQLLAILTGPYQDHIKEEKFYKMLQDTDVQVKLDPILSFYPTNEPEKKIELAKKRFDKFISDAIKNKPSVEELTKSFEQFKMKLGNSILKDHCEQTPTYESLCINSENIHAGNKGTKVKADIVQAIKRRDLELDHKDDSRLKSISLLFNKKENDGIVGMTNTEMSMMLLENARCVSFDYEYASIRNLKNGKSTIEQLSKETPFSAFITTDGKSMIRELRIAEEGLDNKDKLLLARARKEEYHEELQDPERRYFRNRPKDAKERDLFVYPKMELAFAGKTYEPITDEKKVKEQSKTSERSNEETKPEASNSSELHAQSKEYGVNRENGASRENREDTNSDGYTYERNYGYQQDYSRWNGNPSSYMATNLSNNEHKRITNAVDTEVVQDFSEDSAQTAITKSVAKKESSKASDDSKNVKKTSSVERKSEDSSQSLEQLKGLRDELSKLKESLSQAQTQKESENVQSQKTPLSNNEWSKTRNVSDEIEIDGGERIASVNKNDSGAQSHQVSGQGTSSASSQSSSTSSGSSSKANSSTDKGTHSSAMKIDSGRMSASSNFKSAENYALVLNTQENTAEQNESAIVDNIVSNNGKSFEVMMDGVPVKIVPLVEKGKLVYEKGKPKYQIFVKDEKGAKEPKSVADLKIIQEKEIKQTSDRALYQKLREISGKALQVK